KHPEKDHWIRPWHQRRGRDTPPGSVDTQEPESAGAGNLRGRNLKEPETAIRLQVDSWQRGGSAILECLEGACPKDAG
ncbi:MAG: hypothetical protein ACK5PZ_15015, partial [Pirellula sp.]